MSAYLIELYKETKKDQIDYTKIVLYANNWLLIQLGIMRISQYQ